MPAIPRRSDVIGAQRECGGRVAAVLPIHYPRALLRAFELLPVEVWGPPRVDATLGAAHLQPYVCSVVRNALAFLLSGGLDAVDVIVVPHACDSLQGLGSLMLDFVRPRQPVLPVYVPRLAGERAVAFLADELRALYRGLAAATGLSPAADALLASIAREEAADASLVALHRTRAKLPLATAEFYRLVRAREYLPAETFVNLAAAVLSADGAPPDSGVPIVLSGIVPEPASLFDALAGMGARVAADDLACCGRRLYPPGRSTDPYRRMAESLLGAPPDPMRGSPLAARRAHLAQLVAATGAKGVVFYDVKFCEPELFDLPTLRGGLQVAGIPSIAVEVDLGEPLTGQVLTRLQAFVEMLA